MYVKLFQSIYDSSLADDWQARVVFQDFLNLADPKGVVDMTPESIARRTNVPLEIVKHGIVELEKVDPRSRTPDEDGRRIVRLDSHRDWGWRIVNFEKYRSLKNEDDRREQNRLAQERHRTKQRAADSQHASASLLTNADSQHASAESAQEVCRKKDVVCNKEPERGSASADTPPAKRFVPPSLDEIKLAATKAGLPDLEAEKFHAYYESNGWRVGRNPMRSWTAALAMWKSRYQQPQPTRRPAGPAPLPTFTETRQLRPDEL